jgi:hypothetical protein
MGTKLDPADDVGMPLAVDAHRVGTGSEANVDRRGATRAPVYVDEGTGRQTLDPDRRGLGEVRAVARQVGVKSRPADRAGDEGAGR